MDISKESGVKQVTIVPNSDVLFDWDNTLKKIDRSTKCCPPKIFLSVQKEILQSLLSADMNCRIFILTAISNSRMGIQTLNIELERLGVQSIFLQPGHEDKIDTCDTPIGSFWHWGNCFTCGSTPKADVYLHCCRDKGDSTRPVYFFDDEINNIQDFRMALPDSTVCHVTDEGPININLINIKTDTETVQ